MRNRNDRRWGKLLWSVILMGALSVVGSGEGFAQLTSDAQDRVDAVEREFERTDALLEHVRELVRETDSPKPRELFQNAVALQEQGRKVLERALADTPSLGTAALLREALGLTLRSRDMAREAGTRLREQVGLQERARREIDRASDMLSRADESGLGRNDRVAGVLAEARRQISAARQHYTDYNYEVALRLAESATFLLTNLADDIGDARRGERLREEIERTQRLYERARENSSDLDDDEVKLLERAAELLRRAREALRRGEPRRALTLNNEARGLLRTLLEGADDQVDAGDVERATERFDAAYERLVDVVGDSPSPEIQRLMESAQQSRREAQVSAGSGDFERALAQLRVGLDQLGRARRLASGDR